MYKYIVVKDTVWVDDNFNTNTYPTIVEVKQLSGRIEADNHHAFSGGEMGKIFIDGVMYNDPSEIPEEEE
tara:strand:+ start:612 stop:821 length:210 start_codon:yes stop_codon:yes gene_type:complete